MSDCLPNTNGACMNVSNKVCYQTSTDGGCFAGTFKCNSQADWVPSVGTQCHIAGVDNNGNNRGPLQGKWGIVDGIYSCELDNIVEGFRPMADEIEQCSIINLTCENDGVKINQYDGQTYNTLYTGNPIATGCYLTTNPL